MPGPAFWGWALRPVMLETRFSARRGNGFLLFSALMAASLAPHVGQAAPQAQSTPNTAPQHSQQPPAAATAALVSTLTTQLAHARTVDEAHTLQAQLEALRASGLSPTTQLLVRRAEKDLTAEKPDDAVEDMGDALALQPDQAILWRSRAQMRLVAGALDGAVADLGQALQRDPTDAESWSLLSKVEEHRNDGAAALKAWNKATALNPMLDRSHKRQDSLRLKAFGQPS